ncbi:hypothetical protein ASE01_22935 [Nocardioides sp. Root190]|uniref:hypothetical protein n=1 Tax=Nocardioides sp. Root190 TaxID=1736488 RepID=UPI0006FA6494|nr:hypothetical protein [Nocardioides sp. Root190]KRB79589.1 hypothetical protein ASE01_22935 [Nocardioides sp. Root190]
MTEMRSTDAPAAPDAPTRRAAVVCSAIALAVGLLEIAAGVVFWYLTSVDTSDDPLVGIGYVFAIALAAPGMLGVVLAALGWLLARRTAGLGLAIAALVVAAGPAMLYLWLVVPWF